LALAILAHAAMAGGEDQRLDARTGMQFSRIEAGCFDMGQAREGNGVDGYPVRIPRRDEVPRHRVCLGAFSIARTEVTRMQWFAVMTGDRATEVKYPDQPMTDISWVDIQKFIGVLNEGGAQGQYRLPTEAEWEYACLAGGAEHPTQLLEDARAQALHATVGGAVFGFPRLKDPSPQDVGSRRPNAWGLYDMLGNVWEWVDDDYLSDAYGKHASLNPRIRSDGRRKVIRGGSYKSELESVRCGVRSHAPASDRSPVMGFRLVSEDLKN
jgi:formylglycine-generating enzyme required for sulfatase activity